MSEDKEWHSRDEAIHAYSTGKKIQYKSGYETDDRWYDISGDLHYYFAYWHQNTEYRVKPEATNYVGKMTNKELLELAAKAAGIEVLGVSFEMDGSFAGFPTGGQKVWNPLTDDGDALRLAVKLKMDIDNNHPLDNDMYVCVHRYGIECVRNPISAIEEFDDETQRYAATRRAIVRAAAEIGRTL